MSTPKTQVRPTMNPTQASVVVDGLREQLPLTQDEPAEWWTDVDTETLDLHNRICRALQRRGFEDFHEIDPPEGVDLEGAT